MLLLRGMPPQCRGYKPPQVTEAHRRYWLERYTLAEIRELAEAIWGHAALGADTRSYNAVRCR